MLEVPPIEAQLDDLAPSCTLRITNTAKQRAGEPALACGNPAIAVAHVHNVDDCNLEGLSRDGDYVEILCELCVARVRNAIYQQWQNLLYTRHLAACLTCGRPLVHPNGFLTLLPIESAL